MPRVRLVGNNGLLDPFVGGFESPAGACANRRRAGLHRPCLFFLRWQAWQRGSLTSVSATVTRGIRNCHNGTRDVLEVDVPGLRASAPQSRDGACERRTQFDAFLRERGEPQELDSDDARVEVGV